MSNINVADTANNSVSSAKNEEKVSKSYQVKLPTLQELLEAGAHFGHKSSRWNPQMSKYIFDTRAGIHIIDLAQTLELLHNAVSFLYEASAKGNVLLVGTKGQAATLIKKTGEDHGAFYVSKRWPGGLLTNFKNVHKSVDRLMEIEENLAAKKGYTTKKERLLMERDRDRLQALYEGIKFMDKVPSVMIVIDTRVEKNAIKEARNLGVKVVGLIDTNCDPTLVDYPIPANDDAIRSIELFINVLVQGFTSSSPSAQLISKRNDRADRVDQIRRATQREEERLEREEQKEAEKLKAMKEGKLTPEQSASSEGKVLRVVKKADVVKTEESKEAIVATTEVKTEETSKGKTVRVRSVTKASGKLSKKDTESSKNDLKVKKSAKEASVKDDAKKAKKTEKSDGKGKTTLEDLKLGSRINNALEANGIKTIAELAKYDEAGLTELKGLGATSAKKILEVLKKLK